MIIKRAEKINKEKRVSNCRVQALCDLLVMKGINVSPYLLYLVCMKSPYTFAEVIYNHVSYPFISSFDEDLETQLFEEFNLSYSIFTNELSLPTLKNILNDDEPFILLCDANSVLKRRKNKNNMQIGVCSGITVIGYNALGRVVFSELNKKKQFSDISYNLLSYSRDFEILPSSPFNISIHLHDDYTKNQECRRKLNDYSVLSEILRCNLTKAISEPNWEERKYTNKNLEVFNNQKAKERLLAFLDTLQETISNSEIDQDILNKIFSLKFRLLRKSMISGTSSFNRLEIAESVYALWELNPDKKLHTLYLGFQESAHNFRNIIRKLYFVNDMLDKKEEFLMEIRHLLSEAFEYEYKLISNFLA